MTEQSSSRTLFIGDIHGCLSEFQSLLKKLNFSEKDEIICVGDLIAKGPNSCGVLKFIREINAKSGLTLNYLENIFASHTNIPHKTE